jgi:hypothetical protein
MKDSKCTQFCDKVKDTDWRHKCFMQCNAYLEGCLSKGVWTDQLSADPGTSPVPPSGPKGKAGIVGFPASGGLLDANPGLPSQGPAGTGVGGGTTTTAPSLR